MLITDQKVTCTDKININETVFRALDVELIDARKCIEKMRIEKSVVEKNKEK